MTPSTKRSGVVLAGGYSRRFEAGDKALAEIEGEPMLRRVVSRLGTAVDRVVVNCRADQRDRFDRVLDGLGAPVTFALDPVADEGPLAGLATALDTVETEYVAVAACDMPALDPTFVAYLFERARGHDVALPELPDGHRQPAQAVYRCVPTVAAARSELSAGRRSLRGLVDHLDTAVVTPAEVTDRTTWESLRDVNTLETLENLEL